MLEANWSAIPNEILVEISKHCDDADYINLRSVCNSWQIGLPKRPLIPWIISHTLDQNDNLVHGLYKFPDAEAYLSPILQDGVMQRKFPIGISRGWIALIDDTPRISLHNPFTGKKVNLPRLPSLPWISKPNEQEEGYSCFDVWDEDDKYCRRLYDYFLVLFMAYGLVLSSQPKEEDCEVMALSKNGLKLIYCRRGISWQELRTIGEDYRCYSDLIFYRGKFYAVYMYRVFVCDIRTEDAQVREILPSDSLFSDGMTRSVNQPWQTSFLVVSSGELLLVAIKRPHSDSQCLDSICHYNCREYKFEVFQVDLGSGEDSLRLNKKESLGGRVLFLGTKSMSVSADGSLPCRKNCIYYIDDYFRRTEENIIVMNMEDGSISSVTGFSRDRLDALGFQWLTPRFL